MATCSEEEILINERDYVESLQFIHNSYMQPLERWFQDLKISLTSSNPTTGGAHSPPAPSDSILNTYLLQNMNLIDGIFKNITSILELHVILLQALEAAGMDRTKILNALLKYCPHLLIYLEYIQNSSHSLFLLQNLRTDIRLFALPRPLILRLLDSLPFSWLFNIILKAKISH
jgi:hypothetical protein